jgi:hypothetical protein
VKAGTVDPSQPSQRRDRTSNLVVEESRYFRPVFEMTVESSQRAQQNLIERRLVAK